MKAARLIVLGIAVAAGGVAAILAGGRGQAPAPAPAPQIATVDVLVAKNDIGMGTKLSPNDLQWQTWPTSAANAAFIRKNEQPDALQQYEGAIARVAMSAGEPVRDNKLIKAKGSGYMAAILPAGMRATAVEISAESGAAGFILPNDRVDVILSRRDREAEKATGIETNVGETILTNVRVLAIDQLVQERTDRRSSSAGPRPSRCRSRKLSSWRRRARPGRYPSPCAAWPTPPRRSMPRQQIRATHAATRSARSGSA
jgi:pilus assembly protein CpaB